MAAALRAGSSRREVVVAAAEQSLLSRVLEPIKALLGRGAVYGSFMVAKQPARIRQARPEPCMRRFVWRSSPDKARAWASRAHGARVSTGRGRAEDILPLYMTEQECALSQAAH